MAAALRIGLRQFRTPWRRWTSTYAKEIQEEEVHALKTMVTWRYISLLVAIPGVLLTCYNAVKKEMTHMKHVEEHGVTEFVGYSHLRLRNKPFPWGDGNHSLIHNSHANALPDGYEGH